MCVSLYSSEERLSISPRDLGMEDITGRCPTYHLLCARRPDSQYQDIVKEGNKIPPSPLSLPLWGEERGVWILLKNWGGVCETATNDTGINNEGFWADGSLTIHGEEEGYKANRRGIVRLRDLYLTQACHRSRSSFVQMVWTVSCRTRPDLDEFVWPVQGHPITED